MSLPACKRWSMEKSVLLFSSRSVSATKYGHFVTRLEVKFATQMFVPSKASRLVLPVTGNVPTNVPSLARSFVTLLERFDTQMFVPSKAIPVGALATGKVPSTTPSLARRLITLFSERFAIQMFSPSKAVPNAGGPQGPEGPQGPQGPEGQITHYRSRITRSTVTKPSPDRVAD